MKEMKVDKKHIELFIEILNKVMTNLNYSGRVVGHHNDKDDTIIFQFSTVASIDEIYPAIENDYEHIRNAVNSRTLQMRKYNSRLELRFPRIVVRLAVMIKAFNPELNVRQ